MSRPDTITGLSVKGFKSIADEQYIALRPLTVLAGANSSGKSSIMQPLLLLKQTLEAPGDPGSLWLGGPNVRFTAADQLLSRLPKCPREFSVKLHSGPDQFVGMTYTHSREAGFEVSAMDTMIGGERSKLRASMSHEELANALPQYEKMRKARSSERDTKRWCIVRDRCFLRLELRGADGGRTYWVESDGFLNARPYYSMIQGVIHLPGLRGNPQRDYPRQAVGRRFPGPFDPYAASVVEHWQKNDKGKLAELGSVLGEMGLTWKVQAAALNDTAMELMVGRLPRPKRGGARDLVSIADVGLGVSQSLPVVVALLAAQKGQLLYLEQPEIHLHPLAQRSLAKVLAAAARRGIIVVVETHSALLLREMQTLVAKDELDPKEVALHWFRRDKDGATTVKTAQLDDTGAYGDWPEDFDDTELRAEQEYLDAVEAKGGPQ